jgi:tetratricopeptide (TPR) repeat protein
MLFASKKISVRTLRSRWNRALLVCKLAVAMTSQSLPARFAVLALAATFLLSGCHSAKSYLEKGNALFAQGQFAEATLNYRKAIQKDPGFGEAYYRAGLAELKDTKDNKVAEALQDLQQGVRMMPDNQAARTDLTNLLLGAYIGDARHPKFLYDLLVQYSAEWLARDPNSMQGLRIKGYLAMLERRPEEAVELFRRAYQSNPQDEKMALSLMDALFRDDQKTEAEKVGLAYVASHPTAADVYDALYRLYSVTNRSDDARNILVRKVSNNPQHGEYILQLASFHLLDHNKPEMDKAMQMFLKNPGGDPQMHLKAGDFYASIGDWASALQQYNAGLAQASKDKLEYKNRIARALLFQDKKPEALNTLNEILSQDSNDREALALRAALMLDGGKSDQSRQGVSQLQALVDKSPDNLFFRFTLSKALAETGDLAGARAQLQQILKRNANFLDAQLSLADVAFRLGSFDEAVEHSQAALRIDPKNVRAQLLQARSLMRLGSLEQAGTVLGDLSRQEPDSLDVRIELARLLLLQKRYGDAEAAFNKILISNPGEFRAIGGLVDIDVAENRADKALARLDQELTRSHGSPKILYLAAVTALRTGRFAESIDDLQRLADKTPDSIDPQLELAAVLRLRGDYRRAIDTLRKAAVLQPKDPRPTTMLSSLLEMTNQQQEAKALARKVLNQEPTNKAAMNNLAFLLAETGDDLDQALKLAQEAINGGSTQPYFEDTLGYIYLRKGKNDQAMQIFDQLVRSFPREPIFSYHLGMTYFQMGDRTRAKAILTKTLQMRPPKDVETGASDLIARLN